MMTAVKGPGERGKLYEFAAGTMPSIATDHLGGQLYRSAIVEQIQLYKDSHDALHLWRAWRTARIAGDIPPDVFAVLAPMIDQFTEEAIDPKRRAEERTNRYYVMRDYYYLKGVMENPNGRGAPKSDTEIYRKLAKSFHTTAGAIKQMVLEHTGRGQRGRNRRERRR